MQSAMCHPETWHPDRSHKTGTHDAYPHPGLRNVDQGRHADESDSTRRVVPRRRATRGTAQPQAGGWNSTPFPLTSTGWLAEYWNATVPLSFSMPTVALLPCSNVLSSPVYANATSPFS